MKIKEIAESFYDPEIDSSTKAYYDRLVEAMEKIYQEGRKSRDIDIIKLTSENSRLKGELIGTLEGLLFHVKDPEIIKNIEDKLKKLKDESK